MQFTDAMFHNCSFWTSHLGNTEGMKQHVAMQWLTIRVGDLESQVAVWEKVPENCRWSECLFLLGFLGFLFCFPLTPMSHPWRGFPVMVGTQPWQIHASAPWSCSVTLSNCQLQVLLTPVFWRAATWMISVHLPRSQTWEKPAWLPRPLFVPHPWVLCCFKLMRFVVSCWGQILILLILWRPKASKLQAIRWLLNRVTAEKWQMHAPSVHQQELVGTHFLRPCRKRSKLVFWMVCKLRFVSQRFSSLCWQTWCYYCCCFTVIHVFPLHQPFPGCGHIWALSSRNLQSTLVRFTEDGCVGAGCDFQLSIEPLHQKGCIGFRFFLVLWLSVMRFVDLEFPNISTILYYTLFSFYPQNLGGFVHWAKPNTVGQTQMDWNYLPK
jgi:hypothetical protein